MNMWLRFSANCRRAFFLATQQAQADPVTPRHLLQGILQLESTVAHDFLSELGIDPARLLEDLEARPIKEVSDHPPGLTALAKAALEVAVQFSREAKSIDERHVLLGIASGPDDAADFLAERGITSARLREILG